MPFGNSIGAVGKGLSAFLSVLCAGCLLCATAFAIDPITLTINATAPGCAIPSTFVGISVSSASIDGSSGCKKIFTTSNTQLVNLCKQIGVKHLRTIMGKANASSPDPTDAQIDSFFDFAHAIEVSNVIWSLHLFNASERTYRWSNNKAVAAHIWNT